MSVFTSVKENPLALFLKSLPGMVYEYWSFAKGNARSGNSKSQSKQLTEILMLTHALEKGFSLPNMRKVFGIAKAIKLIGMVERYVQKHGFHPELFVPVSLLESYVAYHKQTDSNSAEIEEIRRRLNSLIANSGYSKDEFNMAGTYSKTDAEMIEVGKGDFKTLAEGRYSVRTFSEKPIDEVILKEAFTIASKSPSACNRQSYRVHVFDGDKKNSILKMQGGANSFYECADKAILITADMNRYYTREPHLGYVDGSLFGMSLIYALTYLGIGSIPLTLGIKSSTLKQMKQTFNISDNETPVMLIAVGHYPESFKVAKSHRNNIDQFVTFH